MMEDIYVTIVKKNSRSEGMHENMLNFILMDYPSIEIKCPH